MHREECWFCGLRHRGLASITDGEASVSAVALPPLRRATALRALEVECVYFVSAHAGEVSSAAGDGMSRVSGARGGWWLSSRCRAALNVGLLVHWRSGQRLSSASNIV